MNNNEKVEHQSNITEGKWIKYEKGSDYNILIKSIQGYHTDWVFYRDEEEGLMRIDVYIYYTLDKNGKAKVPRIMIKTYGDRYGNYKVTSIRGIADGQNMESEMMPILNEKLKEFPDRDKYFKKEQDMNMLTIIDNKVNNNIELTLEELRFLYEIDSEIEGFGYEEDPRIEEIKTKRNIKKDYVQIFKFKVNEEEVALSQTEWEQYPKKYKIVVGDLWLNRLTCTKGLFLPQIIVGDLNLCSLRSTKGLVFSQSIGGNLWLDSLTSAEDLVLPQSIGGDLWLGSLTSAKGLVLPQSIGGDLWLGNLTSAKGLVLPQSIVGDLYLNSLTSTKGLVLPYDFDIDRLICPEYIKYKIMSNPDKYFMKAPEEEKEKRKVRIR